jgi:hypothetical protein
LKHNLAKIVRDSKNFDKINALRELKDIYFKLLPPEPPAPPIGADAVMRIEFIEPPKTNEDI